MKQLCLDGTGRNEIKSKLHEFKALVEIKSQGKVTVISRTDNNGLPHVTMHCNICNGKFSTSHHSDRILYSTDLFDGTHPHFTTVKHKNAKPVTVNKIHHYFQETTSLDTESQKSEIIIKHEDC